MQVPHTAAGQQPSLRWTTTTCAVYLNLEDKETVYYCWPPRKASLLDYGTPPYIFVLLGLKNCIYPPEAPLSTLWPYTLQSQEGMGGRENRKSLLHRSRAGCQDLTDPEESDTPLK